MFVIIAGTLQGCVIRLKGAFALTIMEATVIAILGAGNEPGKALLCCTLLLLCICRAMD